MGRIKNRLFPITCDLIVAKSHPTVRRMKAWLRHSIGALCERNRTYHLAIAKNKVPDEAAYRCRKSEVMI